MRKLIVSDFITLDGVIQAPGNKDEDVDAGFAHGGWTWPYWHDDMGAHIFGAMSEVDTMLFGRKTWQIQAPAFASMPAGDPFGDHMNNTAKVVVSTTLKDKDASAWRNSTVIRKNVVEEVRKLKEKSGKNISCGGSSVLVHALAQHNLVDEYFLFVYPLVLGSGKKLLPDGLRVGLKLIEAKPFPSGVVLMRYQPA